MKTAAGTASSAAGGRPGGGAGGLAASGLLVAQRAPDETLHVSQALGQRSTVVVVVDCHHVVGIMMTLLGKR